MKSRLLDDMQFYELELANSKAEFFASLVKIGDRQKTCAVECCNRCPKADVDDSSSSPTRWHSSSWEDVCCQVMQF